VAHRDAVIHGDGVELLGHAARALDLARHQLSQVLQVHMPGHELGEGVAHGDDRLAEVAILHAGGAPEAAGAGHVAAMSRSAGAIGGHSSILRVPDAAASLKIGAHFCSGFKGELLDQGRQHRRRDLGGRNWKGPQKSGAHQHHRKAEPIVVAAQSSNKFAIGLVQIEISRELVGGRFAVKAGETLTLGVSEVTGGHSVRNFQLLRRGRSTPTNKANSFAKHMCGTKPFCSNFRTVLGIAA
jgi:hypothetical protein